jgi:hypothetical protein
MELNYFSKKVAQKHAFGGIVKFVVEEKVLPVFLKSEGFPMIFKMIPTEFFLLK